ncbi:unnamed protein product [Pylaiella littoralis]
MLGKTLVFVFLVLLLCQGVVEAGIAGFHKWFVGAFPGAVTNAWHPRQQESFDHVCIDMNQILHVAMRKAADEDHAIRRIFRDVNLTLKRCPPRKSVVFAFDGSAPLAKLLVQRGRRENPKRNSRYGVSALHLSPGTKFMEDVASAMEYYAFQECTRPCYEGVRFYISGANVPGEGELKCIDWLKHMSNPGSEESVVIVGGDADLILQGLALSEVKNTFICSQTNTGSFRLSSIWEVVRALETSFPGQSDFVRSDLAVLIMLNGNDYLPKVRGVSFDRCFRSYTALKKGKHRDNFLVNGEARSISWEFLEDILTDIHAGTTAEAKGYPVMSLEQMDLNNRYPTAGSMFNSVVQQGELGEDVEIQMHELSKEDAERSGGSHGPPVRGVKKWRSSTWVRGKEYSWLHTAAKERAAFHEAAAKLLEELVPDVHEKFLEQEKDRLLEQAQLDRDLEDIDSDLDDDLEGGNVRSSRWAGKKPLFDVQEYLTGVLWNLQMYIDGYVPNYYWRYSPRYSPSVSDILSFLQNDSDSLAKVSPPVTQAPPLPAAIACLCMMPMTDAGKAFVPERLQPLLTPGSPLVEALKWKGDSSGLDIPKILRVVSEEAPEELRGFHDGSRSSCGWKVVFLDLSAPQGEPPSPPPPSKDFPPLENSRRCSAYKFKRIQATSLPATSTPRNLAWSSPSNPTWQQEPSILGQPYKTPFDKDAEERGGGRGSRGRGGRGVRGGRGGGRAAQPKSVAWRKKTSTPRIRQGGGAGRGSGGQLGVSGRTEDTGVPNYSRGAPAAEERKARPSPFPSSPRSDTRASMCCGGPALGRSQCRILL